MADDGVEGLDALEFGLAVGFGGMLLDEHAQSVREAIEQAADDIALDIEQVRRDAAAASTKLRQEDLARGTYEWDHFIGQERIKQRLHVHLESAKQRQAPFPHLLLSSEAPGMGKTTLAKVIAYELGVSIALVALPYSGDALLREVRGLDDRDVLFVQDVHLVGEDEHGSHGMLLHLLEEKTVYEGAQQIDLPHVTVVGATTHPDHVPWAVHDRFPIRVAFDRYEVTEMAIITASFEGQFGVKLAFEMTMFIAAASAGYPALARKMVIAARDLEVTLGRPCTSEELAEFLQQ